MEKNATPMPAKPTQNSPHTRRRKRRQFRFRRRARQPLSARARTLRRRRVGIVALFLIGVAVWLIANPASWQTEIIYGNHSPATSADSPSGQNAADSTSDGSGYSPGGSPTNDAGAYYASYVLAQLSVQAPADGSTYEREEQFYSSWPSIEGCNLRQRIIKRDFAGATLDDDNCTVIAGNFVDPYSSQEFDFTQKSEISSGVQIDRPLRTRHRST